MVNYKPHKSGYTLYLGKHVVNSVLDTLDSVVYRITQSEYFHGFCTGIKNALLKSLIIFLISFLLFVAFMTYLVIKVIITII